MLTICSVQMLSTGLGSKSFKVHLCVMFMSVILTETNIINIFSKYPCYDFKALTQYNIEFRKTKVPDIRAIVILLLLILCINFSFIILQEDALLHICMCMYALLNSINIFFGSVF